LKIGDICQETYQYRSACGDTDDTTLSQGWSFYKCYWIQVCFFNDIDFDIIRQGSAQLIFAMHLLQA